MKECRARQEEATGGSPSVEQWPGPRTFSGISPSLGMPHGPAKMLTQHPREGQVKKRMGERLGQRMGERLG